MGERNPPRRYSENPLLRLAGVALFGRIPLLLRGPILDALGRELAPGGSPAEEPEETLPGSDISEAEQKAALHAEQQRRAERRVRREG